MQWLTDYAKLTPAAYSYKLKINLIKEYPSRVEGPVPSLQDEARLQSGEPAGSGALPGDSSAHRDGMLTSVTGHLPSRQHSWSWCSVMEHGSAERAAPSEFAGADSELYPSFAKYTNVFYTKSFVF